MLQIPTLLPAIDMLDFKSGSQAPSGRFRELQTESSSSHDEYWPSFLSGQRRSMEDRRALMRSLVIGRVERLERKSQGALEMALHPPRVWVQDRDDFRLANEVELAQFHLGLLNVAGRAPAVYTTWMWQIASQADKFLAALRALNTTPSALTPMLGQFWIEAATAEREPPNLDCDAASSQGEVVRTEPTPLDIAAIEAVPQSKLDLLPATFTEPRDTSVRGEWPLLSTTMKPRGPITTFLRSRVSLVEKQVGHLAGWTGRKTLFLFVLDSLRKNGGSVVQNLARVDGHEVFYFRDAGAGRLVGLTASAIEKRVLLETRYGKKEAAARLFGTVMPGSNSP